MCTYVIRILNNRQARIIAVFWLKTDAFSWINSYPAAAQNYRVHHSETVFYPGQIINFPEA